MEEDVKKVQGKTREPSMGIKRNKPGIYRSELCYIKVDTTFIL